MNILKFHFGFLLAFSIFFTTVIPKNVQAASVESYYMSDKDVEIGNIFNQFHYAMTVEWDQIDESFPEEAERRLSESLNGLMAQGVSAEEIQKYMESHLLNGKVGVEYNRFLSALRSQGRSSQEITSMTTDFMSTNLNEGLSFNGEGPGGRGTSLLTTVVIVVLVVAVTHLLLKKDKGDDHGCHKKCH